MAGWWSPRSGSGFERARAVGHEVVDLEPRGARLLPEGDEARRAARDDTPAPGCAMLGEALFGDGSRDTGHRARQKPSRARADGRVARVAQLAHRSPRDAGEDLPRGLVDPEAATELTGVVPADRFVGCLRDRRKLLELPGRDLDEELHRGLWHRTGASIVPPQRERASRIHDHYRVERLETARERTRVPLEPRYVSREAQRQPAAAVDGDYRDSRERPGGTKRVARLIGRL